MKLYGILCRATAWLAASALVAGVVRGPWAQGSAGTGNGPGADRADAADVHGALQAWRAAHGATWSLALDAETGFGRFLYGGTAEPPFAPAGDAEYAALARHFAREALALHGVEPETLVVDSVHFLPLGLAGTTDKMVVRFQQEFSGLAVRRSSLHVLMDLGGRLLALDSTALPNTTAADPRPQNTAAEAETLAASLFGADAGVAPLRVGPATVALEQERRGSTRGPLLVWLVDVLGRAPSGEPLGWRYVLAADRSGRRIARENLVHRCGGQVSGQVKSRVTPGLAPDTASNPPAIEPMGHLSVPIKVSPGAVPSIYGGTDAGGYFSIDVPAGIDEVTGVFEYNGLVDVADETLGPDYLLELRLDVGAFSSVLMNDPPSTPVTAQANVVRQLERMQSWIDSVDPVNPAFDNGVFAFVNETAYACDAYYYGPLSSIEFAQAGMANGKSCPNTAYSTVIHHELGHWLNDTYGSGNGPDGFGEGCADTFAMYTNDTAIVGEDFYGSGSILRTGEAGTLFCGDANPGCYGEVHADGVVLMGALWKVRKRLNQTYGDSTGDLVADALFVAWMSAYDDSAIQSIIETHWLVLDDDDGNLYNGTLHYPEIDGGFRDQGFPGFPNPQLDPVYVSAGYLGTELGTAANPFDTLDEGVFTVAPNGTVILFAGNYYQFPTITKPLTLTASGGIALIGVFPN